MAQRTSAESFEAYIPGELLKEHRAQSSRDVFIQILARRQRQDNVIIPAVPEPFIVWILSGRAVVEERPLGGEWSENHVTAGDFFSHDRHLSDRDEMASRARLPFHRYARLYWCVHDAGY